MLSIIVLFLERIDLTKRCVESILRYTEHPFELLLLDNGSVSSRAERFVKEIATEPRVRLLRSSVNLGCPGGRNYVIRQLPSNTKYIASLDNDCRVTEGWDRAAIETLEAFEADAVQPALLKPDGSFRKGATCYTVRGERIEFKPRYTSITGPGNAPEEVNTLIGVFVARREVFDKAGLYDDKLQGFADYDFSYRLRDQGIKLIYEPRCRIIHDHHREVFAGRHDRHYERQRYNFQKMLRSDDYLYEKHGLSFMRPEDREWLEYLVARELEPGGSLLDRIRVRYHRRLFNLRRLLGGRQG